MGARSVSAALAELAGLEWQELSAKRSQFFNDCKEVVLTCQYADRRSEVELRAQHGEVVWVQARAEVRHP